MSYRVHEIRRILAEIRADNEGRAVGKMAVLSADRALWLCDQVEALAAENERLRAERDALAGPSDKGISHEALLITQWVIQALKVEAVNQRRFDVAATYRDAQKKIERREASGD